MHIVSARLIFYIPGAGSLKDKRQVCRSLIDKARQKFNASAAEVGTQDLCQTLTIGVAVVSGDLSHAHKYMDEIVRFMDGNTDAELTDIEIGEA